MWLKDYKVATVWKRWYWLVLPLTLSVTCWLVAAARLVLHHDWVMDGWNRLDSFGNKMSIFIIPLVLFPISCMACHRLWGE